MTDNSEAGMPDELELLLCNYTSNAQYAIRSFLGDAKLCGYFLSRADLATPQADAEDLEHKLYIAENNFRASQQQCRSQGDEMSRLNCEIARLRIAEVRQRKDTATQPPQAASGRERALTALRHLGDSSNLNDMTRNSLESAIRHALTTPLSIQNESQGLTILTAWQLLKASECADHSCNSAYKYLEAVVHDLPPPAVQGQGEAVREAIECLRWAIAEIGEKHPRSFHVRKALDALRALPAEAPTAVDVEALKFELTKSWTDIDMIRAVFAAVDHLYATNRLQSVQPAKESE